MTDRVGVPAELVLIGPADGRARYELRTLLGAGGYGQVFEAWDTQLQRRVAIKRVNLQVDADSWVKEARLASRVQHPAFVAIHDVFASAGFGHIVMELVSGQNLAQRLGEGPVAPRQAVEWMRQASEALAQAHRQQVVHGDIKPANLMVEPDAEGGRLRILDFGVARAMDRLLTLGPGTPVPPAGTLAYMAPEQLLGAPPSVTSDVYALGLVLSELLTGQRSSGGESDSLRIAHRKLHADEAPPALVPGAPMALMDLLRRTLCRQPGQRPASMDELHRQLEALLANWRADRVSPADAPSRRRAWPTLGRRPVRWLGGLLALGLLLGSAWTIGLRWPGMPLPWTERLTQAQQLLHNFASEDGALGRARDLLEQIAAERPTQATVQTHLALAYIYQYTTETRDEVWLKRAEAAAQSAVHLEDQSALAHAVVGATLSLRGRFEDAEREFGRALALDSREPLALAFYVSMLRKQARLDEARAMAERGLAAWPKNVDLLHQQGAVLLTQGDLAGAERAFRASIAAAPRAPIGYANLSDVLNRQGRSDEALETIQQGLSIRPNFRLYTNLGNYLYGKGNYAEAARAFEQAVSPDKGKPNDYLMWANLADTLRWLPGRENDARRTYAHALQLLEPALTAQPKSALLASRAGLYAARMGERAKALQWADKALSLGPEQADVLFRAAVAAELSGQRDLALTRLQQALKRGHPRRAVDEEPDFLALRRDPRYHAMN